MSTALRTEWRGATLAAMQAHVAGVTRTYHLDHQGTVQCLTDDNGVVTDRFSCDAWGNQFKRTGTSINRHWYIGHLGYYRQVDQALDYVRARWMNTYRSRWLSCDPAAATHRYQYSDSAPATLVDPGGLEPTTLRRHVSANCCVNNQPGRLTGGRCHEIPPGDLDRTNAARFRCWQARCANCSDTHNPRGFSRTLDEWESALCACPTVPFVLWPRHCFKVLNCIGTATDAEALAAGCNQSGGHHTRHLAGVGCCIQCGIDVCVLLQPWRKPAAEFCNLTPCDGPTPPKITLPPLKRLASPPGLPPVVGLRGFPECFHDLIRECLGIPSDTPSLGGGAPSG